MYKESNVLWHFLFRKFVKTLICMKLIIVLLCITAVHVCAAGYGQNVTLKTEGATLKTVLGKIRKQTGKDFLYNSRLVNEDQRVYLDIRNVPLKAVLEKVLGDKNLTYEFSGGTILIHPKKQINGSVVKQRSLQGTVLSSSGQVIVGASVTLINANQETSSDANGHFEFDRAPAQGELRISYIGFQTKTHSYDGFENLSITLSPSLETLDEVVVVGYGTQRKSDLTGSIVGVQAKDFTKGANINAFQLINGKAPGVTISQTSSAPGAGTKIQIRGAGSINSNNDALVVVDGLPGIDPASLSPDDIESIDVLKDASAAAIYGTRAANGVVLITTKKGKSGVAQMRYDNYVGMQNVSKKLDVLNGREYMEVLNGIRKDAGRDLIYSAEEIEKVGEGTNWQNELFQKNAIVQNHQISFSGGGDKSRFYSGVNYFGQDGLVRNSGYDKLNFRTNLEFRPKDFIKFTINGNYTRGKQKALYASGGVNENAGALNSAIQFDPTLPAGKDANGRYYLNNFIALDNPLALINGIEQNNLNNTFYGSFTTDITFFKGFTGTVRLGGSTANSMQSRYTDRSTINGLSSGGIGMKNASSGYQWLGEFIANYQYTSGAHDLKVMAGTTFEEFGAEGVGASAMRFLSDVTSYNLLQSGDGDKSDLVESSKSRNRLNGILGRVNYNFDGRYLVTASLRADGTSRFSDDRKYAVFPSGALAWRISEEDFLADWKDRGNSLKLRLGYGQLGNQGISNYQTINTLVASGNAVFGSEIYQGVVPARLPNRNLRWETTEEINIGVDFELLKGRISGSVDAFKRNTKDQLFSKPIPSVVGFSSYMVNYGNVENRGIDFQLNSKNFRRPTWQWDTQLNLALLKNEVKELPDFIPQLITGGIASFISNYQLVERGHAMLSFYGFETDGIFQNEQEIVNSVQPNAKPGHIRFVDQNQDGKLDLNDRTILGKPFPTLNMSLSNSFRYKNISLDFLLQYVGGISMLDANVTETLYPTNEYRNRLANYLLNRWTPENPSSKYPSAVNPTMYGGDYIINSMTIQDASFLRLKNVNINYELFSGGEKINRLNVFLSLENLMTWTKYEGYDPDASATGTSSTSKVAYNSYPLARTVRVGVNLTL